MGDPHSTTTHSGSDSAQNRDQLNQGRRKSNNFIFGVVYIAETDFEHDLYVEIDKRGKFNPRRRKEWG